MQVDTKPEVLDAETQGTTKLPSRVRKTAVSAPVVAQPTTPMDLLRIVTERGAEIAEISAFMDLIERQRKAEAEQGFVRAMTEFKRNPPTIIKNKTAKMQKEGRDLYSYQYADLAAVCGAVVGALAQVGISHEWTTEQGNGLISVTCTLTHELGHSKSTKLSAGADQSGGKNSIQAIGSAVKYLERYTLLAITGIAVQDGEDDDGEGAGVTQTERQELRDAARDMRKRATPADVAAQRQAGAPTKPMDAQLLADARAAADQGRDAFGAFWKSINGEKRTMLASELQDLQRRSESAKQPSEQV